MINKLLDDRNLRHLHLKYYEMSTSQFKKRTTYLDLPGKVYDLYQHVVKACPFCNSTKPRPDSGLRAEEFGGLYLLDHGSTKIGQKTSVFLIILDGATSHLTAYPCKSTSSSEVISKLHEWMDTFQMNPKTICADMAFHHPHDMQAFYRMHKVKRFPTGSHTPCPSRAEMGVRLFKKFLSALVDTASKNLHKTTLSQITPAQLMRKAATIRDVQVTLSDKTPVELDMGRRPRDLMDPASINPEQLTSTPTKQDLLDEEIQKLAMKTHLEIQQREDIRRDLAERLKFVPPDLRTVLARRSEQDPARKKVWKMVEGSNSCCQRFHGCYQYYTSIFQVNASKQRRPLDTVDLEELPDSREQTGAPVRSVCSLTILL